MNKLGITAVPGSASPQCRRDVPSIPRSIPPEGRPVAAYKARRRDASLSRQCEGHAGPRPAGTKNSKGGKRGTTLVPSYKCARQGGCQLRRGQGKMR